MWKHKYKCDITRFWGQVPSVMEFHISGLNTAVNHQTTTLLTQYDNRKSLSLWSKALLSLKLTTVARYDIHICCAAS